MNATEKKHAHRDAARSERRLPTVLEAGAMIALDELPAEFEQQMDASVLLETIAGRTFVRLAPLAGDAS